MHVTDQNSNYDLIIGRDLLTKLGLILNFENLTVNWGHALCAMKPYDCKAETYFHIYDPDVIQQEA